MVKSIGNYSANCAVSPTAILIFTDSSYGPHIKLKVKRIESFEECVGHVAWDYAITFACTECSLICFFGWLKKPSVFTSGCSAYVAEP